MRIITLWQPWASLIALGLKQYETRSWSTSYRGKLAIHAAKRPLKEPDEETQFIELARRFPEVAKAFNFEFLGDDICARTGLPFGQIIAIADLTDCREMIDVASRKCKLHPALQIDSSAQTPLEKAVGDWSELRYAWKLENVIALPESIPCKGRQGLTFAPEEIIKRIDTQFEPVREQLEALL